MKAEQSDNQKVSNIQDIAFKMFLENGYEATSVRSICKSAGIEQPTLYYFFDSKKGLFFSVFKRIWGKQEPRRNKDHSAAQRDHFQSLYTLMYDRMMYTAENQDDIRFFIRFSLFPPVALKNEMELFIGGLEQQYRGFVQNIFEECRLQGLINMDAAKASEVYWKFVNNNTLDLVFSDWKPTAHELEELWGMFVKCRLKGEHYTRD